MSLALDEYIGVADAADRLGVNASTIWRWINQGRLPAYRIGQRRVRLRLADVAGCVVRVRPAEERKVWVRLKDPSEVTPFMSDEERSQMRIALEQAREAREILRLRLAGQELPPTHVLIDEMRDARTRQLMGEE